MGVAVKRCLTGLLVCLSVGLASAYSSSSDSATVSSVEDLDVLFKGTQNAFLPIAPPSEDVYVHLDGNVVPVDWKKFPQSFKKLMYAEMDANGYPLYRVLAYEDPTTRETVFVNTYGAVAFRLAPEAGYDPYLWLNSKFDIGDVRLTDSWNRWIFDPAHIAADFTLIPEVFHDAYLETQQEEAVLAVVMAASPMLMMMSLPVTNLQVAIYDTTNGTVEIELGWPSSFTHELEIFAATNLISGHWDLVKESITTTNSSNFVWEDTASTNHTQRFYQSGDADLDSDNDGLANAREILMYGSNPTNAHSDADGVIDGTEVSNRTDPMNDDDSAPLITIVTPDSTIVLNP